MEVFTQTELKLREEEILDKIKKGAVFIYPTDTIYGIGCSALDSKAVEKIRLLKGRSEAPFSVWVPAKEWVERNCVVDANVKEQMKLLPGPYTLILQLKNKKVIAKSVVPKGDTLGVRIPDHWFGKIVGKLGIPIVTTSANKTNHPFMTTLENLDSDIEKEVDFMIYEGEKEGRPSKVINCVDGIEKER